MKKQTFFPRNIPQQDIALISTMGLNQPVGGYSHYPAWSEQRRGKDWSRRQICRHRTFSLVTSESYRATAGATFYTQWENHIKVNFRLRGRSSTILDGLGQEEHERPEAFIICSPPETLKVDVLSAGTPTVSVALCVLPEFFPEQMGLALEDLPEPLRSLTLAETRPYALHRFDLTRELMVAAHSILASPSSLRSQPAYSQAKAVELMCLLMERMAADRGASWVGERSSGHKARLHEAREWLIRRHAEDVTLDHVCREVGLNRTALTSGFRQLFGTTVYDFLQKVRMERAYELLQDGKRSVAQVAEAVGYAHSCTFSTAFHAYFGCSPRQARPDQR
jgi:AraC-like DNA-binding protein